MIDDGLPATERKNFNRLFTNTLQMANNAIEQYEKAKGITAAVFVPVLNRAIFKETYDPTPSLSLIEEEVSEKKYCLACGRLHTVGNHS